MPRTAFLATASLGLGFLSGCAGGGGGGDAGATDGATDGATEGTTTTATASTTASTTGTGTTDSSATDSATTGTSGSCSDGVCCNVACDDTCDVCKWDIGASEDGVCTPAPFTSPASEACAPQTCDGAGAGCVDLCVDEAAVKVKRPVDVIFVVDNSGSMSEEIAGLEQNINTNFAQVMESSGLDYRVLMVTQHGNNSTYVCVAPPLSGTNNCSGPPVEVPGKFYHYSVNVQSHDALCKLEDTFFGNTPDAYNLHPGGWSTVVRPEALKVFIPMTDDGTSCTWNGNNYNDGNTVMGGQTVAVDWDADLLALSPSQFGTQADRNYVLHGFLGMGPKDPNSPADPWLPTDPATVTECTPGAVDPGTGYQWLAKGTEGLRFPLCDPSGYGAMMVDIVNDTVNKVSEPCAFEVPQPQGKTVDPDKLRLIYTPTVGNPVTFEPVADLAACGASTEAFYVDTGVIHLCPDTCTPVEADATGTVEVEAMCL